MNRPQTLSAEELHVGLRANFERDIGEEEVLLFARLSGDLNPLHLDSAYAARTNLGERIVHGAYQVGLASALVGMHLPGRNVLVGAMRSRFPSPLRYPCRVRVTGEMTTWNSKARAGQVRVLIQHIPSLSVTAEIQVTFGLHEDNARPARDDAGGESARPTATFERKHQRLLLVTGASGGLGSSLVARLSTNYDIIAVTHHESLPGNLAQESNVLELKLDLQSNSAAESMRLAVGVNCLYGIVHTAWPGVPRGGLLQADPDAVLLQVSFGSHSTIDLARVLYHHAGEDGGRLILIGSTAATLKPHLPWAAYSLGKACLEQTSRLLAPEMARKRITVNVVSPSFVPVGINRQATKQSKLAEAASVPLGRLCSEGDVEDLVGFLLSDQAGYISGQVLALTGARL
jgi:3-oxoacyl-[acyl-carrier protein] reductase